MSPIAAEDRRSSGRYSCGTACRLSRYVIRRFEDEVLVVSSVGSRQGSGAVEKQSAEGIRVTQCRDGWYGEIERAGGLLRQTRLVFLGQRTGCLVTPAKGQ